MSGERNKHIVVADDEVYLRYQIQDELNALSEDIEVTITEGSTSLLDHARFGRLGEQPDWIEADVVTLDDRYYNNKDKWQLNNSPYRNKIERKLKEAGMEAEDINYTLQEPRSINFAVALRVLGFKGKIVVVSGDPPSPDKIEKLTSNLNIRKPIINGTVMKGTSQGYVLCSTMKIDPDTDKIKEEKFFLKGERIDAFRKVLGFQNIEQG